MARQNLTQIAGEVAEEMANARRQPFTAFGKEWQGDIFYSDIHFRTKKCPATVHAEVCQILRDKGFYIHS